MADLFDDTPLEVAEVIKNINVMLLYTSIEFSRSEIYGLEVYFLPLTG